MRRKMVAGNWKMNLSAAEAVQLAEDIRKGLSSSVVCEVILFPSFIYLNEVMKRVEGSVIKVGAQNGSAYENGAYTGEVSAAQLRSMGAEYVLIGHSERREYFGEHHAMLKEKLNLALKHGLRPVFCCGEPLPVREKNQQQEYVWRQLEESLFVFTESELKSVIIAYEPVWAIGTGLTATPAQAQEMHLFIRHQLRNKYPGSLADDMRILYGGSCKPDNAAELFACADVDGGLIGGASLKAKDFIALTEAAR